jgi:hypothetical protein
MLLNPLFIAWKNPFHIENLPPKQMKLLDDLLYRV